MRHPGRPAAADCWAGAQGGEELERTVAGVDALRDTPARNGRGCCAISETCRGLMDNERILELVVDACETESWHGARPFTSESQTTPLLGDRRLEHPDEGLHLRLHGTLGRSRAGHPRRAQRRRRPSQALCAVALRPGWFVRWADP